MDVFTNINGPKNDKKVENNKLNSLNSNISFNITVNNRKVPNK